MQRRPAAEAGQALPFRRMSRSRCAEPAGDEQITFSPAPSHSTVLTIIPFITFDFISRSTMANIPQDRRAWLRKLRGGLARGTRILLEAGPAIPIVGDGATAPIAKIMDEYEVRTRKLLIQVSLLNLHRV